MTLVEFLLVRIAEDETLAADLMRHSQDTQLRLKEPRLLGTEQPGWFDWPKVEAMCRRVLAECESKRALISLYQEHRDLSEVDGYFLWFQDAMLSDLALPYADHPDYVCCVWHSDTCGLSDREDPCCDRCPALRE